ncbi:MAG: hypothetical protein PHW87_07770 [Methanothrix sp.]|nr:hypothetical protein [Methanothrix sp.]
MVERSDAVHQLADPCGPPAAAPDSRRAVVAAWKRLSLVAAARGPGRPALLRCRQGRAGLPGKCSCAQKAGRAAETGAHVCKPRRFSEGWMPIGLGNL